MSEATARHLPAEIWRIIANLEVESTLPKDGYTSSKNHTDDRPDDLLTGGINTMLDRNDRAKLSRVCKAARTALLPTLYRRLDLRRDGSQKLLRTLNNNSRLAALVQRVFWDISIDAALSEVGEVDSTADMSPTHRIRHLHPLEESVQQQNVSSGAAPPSPASPRS